MGEIRQRLNDSLRAAMKVRDAAAASAFRSAIGAIDNAEAVERPQDPAPQTGRVAKTRLGVGVADFARRELSKQDVIEILRAEVADRTLAAAQYERMGRADRAASLRAEEVALLTFLDDA